jgi:hypothetical protein
MLRKKKKTETSRYIDRAVYFESGEYDRDVARLWNNTPRKRGETALSRLRRINKKLVAIQKRKQVI